LTIQEKIRSILVRRDNMSEAELARRLDVKPSNLGRKMKSGKFSNTDLEKIASVLNCTVILTAPKFKMNDTGDEY